MVVEVPEIFLKNPNILQLENLTMLHYFNHTVTQEMHVKINQHLLLHVFHGTKIVKENTKSYKINAKESLFISRGHYIMSEILSLENHKFDGVMIFFDDAFLMDFFAKYLKNFQNTSAKKSINISDLLLVQKESFLHETILSMKTYLNQKNPSKVLLQLKFEEILVQALENDSSQELSSYLINLYANGLVNFKNIFEKEEFLNVENMIRSSRLSEEKFRKVFALLYNQTPKKWLEHRALEKAKNLLQEGVYNVTDVSHMSGFSSFSWFIQQFKSKYGLTPKQYQQNHQKQRQN